MLLEIFHSREVVAMFVVRVFLGCLFFFQGFDAVFRIKVHGVLDTIKEPLLQKGVPDFFISIGAYYTSYVNLICGFLLIIGFAKYYALYFIGADILMAAFAFSIIKPMWDMQYVFPRLALVVFFLIAPAHWDVISVDYAWSVIKFMKSIINNH